MMHQVNPQDTSKYDKSENSKQTVEIRSGDGSANIYLYVAALIAAAQHGIGMKDSLKVAEDLYVNVNIFRDENKAILDRLNALPISCYDSAECLAKKREIFEANDVFPKGLIDSTIGQLQAYNDKDLSERLFGNEKAIYDVVMKYINVG
jgi:glutamine synthetase